MSPQNASPRQMQPLDDESSPTNDPRPLGGLQRAPNKDSDPQKEDNEAPTNDPRPLGGSTEMPKAPTTIKENKEQPSWKDPVEEAEDFATDVSDGPSALLSSAKDTATEALRNVREKATGAFESGKKAVKNLASLTNGGDLEQAASRAVDEVDLTPEEQLTRHHVELDENKLHHYHPHHEGALEKVKHKAENVVHSVVSHLPGTHSSENEPTAPPVASQSQVTLSGLRYKAGAENETFDAFGERMDMAKVAEGRNVVPTGQRKLSLTNTSAAQSGGSDNADADFPETLQDAIKGAGDDPVVPAVATTAAEKKAAEDVEVKEGLAEPEPFGITSGARSKL